MKIKKFNESLSDDKGFGQSTNAKFKLGLDLHGVVDSIPDTFAFLTQSIVKNGGEVHIITGGSFLDTDHNEDIVSELKRFGVAYTHLFSIRDYHDEVDTPKTGIHKKYGFPTISDEAWDLTKSDYCRHHNINLHIDDTLMYNDYFTTPFARLWTHSNTPKAPTKDPRHLK